MQCCLLKLALSSQRRVRTRCGNQHLSCHSQILPGRGVEAALALSRAVPLLLLEDEEGKLLVSAVVMERARLPAPWGSWDRSFTLGG